MFILTNLNCFCIIYRGEGAMSKNFYLYSVFIFFILTAGVFAKDSPKDLYLKGKESHFNGKYEEAIFYFKESLSLNPNYAEPLLELAKIYDELELYDYSYDYLTKAAFLTNNTDMTIYLADIETKLGRYDTAEKKYKDILSRNPLEIRASNGLANIYLRTNRKILAKKSLDEILKKDHKNFSALSKLAKYYEDIDLNKAENYYVANVENNSLNPDSYLEYSIFCFNNGMIIKAIDNVKTAVTISDKSIYKKYYAKYLLFMNRGDEALKLFKEILKNEGEVNYLSYYHLAYCYYLLSDFDNAKLSIKRATGLRGDDETSQYFLNYLLINKYDVDDESRKNVSDNLFSKAVAFKRESKYDLFINNLKESIRVNPKNVAARLELADYFKSSGYFERYLNELKVAAIFSEDEELSDKIELVENSIGYKLENDWKIKQYDVKNDVTIIPIFIKNEINNQHYNFSKIYARLLQDISYENHKFEIKLFDEEEYSTPDKIRVSKKENSPYYLDLYAKEEGNSVSASLNFLNSESAEIIKNYQTYQMGNDRLLITANNLVKKLAQDVPFRAHILKIIGDKALINSGKRSSVKLRTNLIILKNKKYNIDLNRAKFIYNNTDVKGGATVVKVDENISEIIIRDNDYFKDIDVGDIVIVK